MTKHPLLQSSPFRNASSVLSRPRALSYSDCSEERLETYWRRHDLSSRSPPSDLKALQRSASLPAASWFVIIPTRTNHTSYSEALTGRGTGYDDNALEFRPRKTLKETPVSRWLGTSYSFCVVTPIAQTWFKQLLRVGVAQHIWSRCSTLHKICTIFPSQVWKSRVFLFSGKS